MCPVNPQPVPSNSPVIIEMQNLVKTFVSSAGEFTALRGINLNLQEG